MHDADDDVPNLYWPPSDFLRARMGDNPPAKNDDLRCLLELTEHEHPANRSWATLLLAEREIDIPEVREALLAAACDDDDYVRAEAILGLARRDKAVALPLLQRELGRNRLPLTLFEAAALIAHPSVVEQLRAFATPSGDREIDSLTAAALRACETGASRG